MTERPTSGRLDELVDSWLTLPDLAEALGVDVGHTRRLVADRRLVGVRRGERSTFQVPARFLVPAHLVDPSNAVAPRDGDTQAVLASLHGTFSVLTDVGLGDADIIEWMFTPSDELGEAPIDALRTGRKARVRQVAQTLA